MTIFDDKSREAVADAIQNAEISHAYMRLDFRKRKEHLARVALDALEANLRERRMLNSGFAVFSAQAPFLWEGDNIYLERKLGEVKVAIIRLTEGG
jgi:hypothetical protein